MKKQIITLSIVAAISIGFTGCMGGGGELTVPVTKRAQDVDTKVMADIKANSTIELQEKLKQAKYSNTETSTLGELKDTNEELYSIIFPIAQEAKKMYAERALSEDITREGASWLAGDINTLKVTTTTTGNAFSGRFYPFSDLVIFNAEKSSEDINLAKFIVAHEFAHAISLHVSEDKTAQLKMLDGAEDSSNIALDIAINEAYMKLQDQDKEITDLIDQKVSENVFANFFNEQDLKNEEMVVKARSEGFAAKAAIAANQEDKLNKLGINLAVPLKTKMVLKHLINSGLDASGAIDALKGGVDFASANANALTGHPKTQEMEADTIALELNKRLGNDTKAAACKRFANDKPAGIFDAHPSHNDRRENLNCSSK